jgi:hypothetical protein
MQRRAAFPKRQTLRPHCKTSNDAVDRRTASCQRAASEAQACAGFRR